MSKIHKKENLENILKNVILEFKFAFIKKDNVIGNYGENCFASILVAAQASEALRLCRIITEKISASKKFNIGGEKITLHIGIASYPANANSVEDLVKEAENAFLKSLEKPKGNITISRNICYSFDTGKSKIPTIAERNKVINNIINIIPEKNNFLILGHKDPDADCIASMVAFSLIIKKFQKKVTIVLYKEYQHKSSYLIQICKYNDVSVIESEHDIGNNFDVVIALDTPKPSMLEGGKKTAEMIANKSITKIEVDHHLGADSGYIGDNNYCFVDEASSTCELIAYLTFKLSDKKQYNIPDLFSRNFVVAILTGLISDSKMGKYLKSARQSQFYKFFSDHYNKMLLEKTYTNSSNFSSIEDIFNELEKLSEEEKICYNYFIERKKISAHIAYIVIDKNEADYFHKNFKKELVASTARHLADNLAEESGYLSIIVYYDNPEESDLIQFRMRRSHTFSKVDLRDIIKEINIESGGGHPGAVGFRVKQSNVSDLTKIMEEIISKIEDTLNRVLKPL